MSRHALEKTLAAANREGALAAMESELAGERAAGLGRLGRALEEALAALREPGGTPEGRAALIDAAAAVAWRYFIQREACGLVDQTQPIIDFGISPQVLRRVGATG